MKFIHVADIHASRERLPQTLSILNTLIERCKHDDIDCIIFAGDFWDSTITATKGSGFSDIIFAIRELEKYVYRIYFIYGTPSHEPLGSLAAFSSETIQITSRMNYCACDKFEIIAIPEPRRSDYVGLSAKETDDSINESIKEFIKAESNRHVFSEIKTPRIVVYHGEVKGAVYQNGVSASSPTAISKELLQSLNADYYALGHIHMPQEVFPNAWYPGSACPKNFGETHDGHYNLVTIENGKTEVEQVSFGLPTYETICLDSPNFPFIKPDVTPYINKHLRVCFNCTKEEKKALNIRQLADEIKARTNAISVKLEPNVIDDNIIPISEVSKRKSIVEKMIEYAKEKDVKLPKYAKELLQNIQDNTLIKLSYPQHSFELLSISLRGAIGIRDGQNKEEISFDFEKYEDGVVCLIGENGHGKTTLIENCHPYPCMLTREGTLKEHFYLKDSHRILIYKDENGLYYKISMFIDGKTASGKVSYFVETSKDREDWKPLPDVDGSFEKYKQWVNSTFGSVDIFLRTAFFAKEPTKNASDISDTTKSERMELLSKLAGTDQLKEVSVIAKDLRKEIEKSIDKLCSEIEIYSHYKKDIQLNNENIRDWSREQKEYETIVSDLEKTISELRIKDAEYQKVKAIAEANAVLYEQYQKEFDETKSLFDKYEEAVNNSIIFDKVDSSNHVISNNAPLIEDLMKKSDDVNKQIENLTELTLQKQKEESKINVAVNKIQSEIKYCKSQIVDIEEVCPTCGQPISEHKKHELLFHVNESKAEVEKLEKELSEQNKLLEEVQSDIKDIETKRYSLADKRAKIEDSLADLQSESQSCSDFITNLDEIYTKYTYDDVVEKHMELDSKLNELQSKMDKIIDSECVEDVSDELYETESKLKRMQDKLSEFKALIKAAEKENEKYSKELESIEDKEKDLKDLSDKVTAYNFIEDAFSNNGIPAIELRESAPEIAVITNKILADSYGKFEIRFGSTSDLKTNRKSNEDFNIIVYDIENGDEKTIDLVSSGERIWIKQALFYAFSIVQMNRTGFNFRVRLIDESDGSLDGDKRPKYLQMVTSAHKQASSRLTILITHSQEIKDIAQQIIEM